ncbi:transposase, IS605 OrfB family, central region [Halorubrum xinjiangense]|uniref:Transposase n=1 Tax=Halorubrum xinjiangense TaxID=261291 RepID=A0A1G7RAA9_9EURY|nr:RNA-guided endonuclease TnpB family protein [Halorubrum xinjiangense]SDF37887.1 transposase, IS605 OrfB family, central region [Halorubrum xinjiangense]SDF56434.1 transposase [Halorubrum xinjiangense]SDG07624.1 transposase, IS605 OrfB family, central region [Halorubrum xinjiangense]
MLEVHRTHRAKILNHNQVAEILDRHGWSASKLWNVANYHSREVWEETGEIPDHGDLKDELKTHNKYKGLHSQSSQRVLEELAEAFNSWYEKRKSDDRANPPGYRKRNYYDTDGNRVHEEHPRSTVTWKQNGIRHDTKNNRVRLSKGANHKEHPRAREYILVEYETRPGVTVENLQQVRAVYDQAKERWELHLVCTDETKTPTAPGTETAGIDLGISNFAAVAYSTEDADLYPGTRLKQDGYYFPKEIAKCDDSGGERATRLHAKWSERRTHFFHGLAKHIVQRCIEKGVGRINIGNLEGVREDENGNSKNWGKHGNLDLHGWAFNRFTNILEYKAKVEGIEVVEVDESATSKTCCMCGREEDSQRVERGLYVCEECDAAFNADVNGAENIRLNINEKSNSESPGQSFGDRSTGWLAQPAVHLYDLSSGFQPQEQVVDCKP